jgi:DNA-binding beta-propeller fold protein YncE
MRDSEDSNTGPSVAYEPVPGWSPVPAAGSFAGDATAVAVDAEDNVFVFSRGPVPVLILDSSGASVGSWGAGEFVNPHALTIDSQGHLYLVDSRGGHVVQKRTRDGQLLLEIGSRGEAKPAYSGLPFHAPTDVAVHPRSGEIFVSDGYGNARIHRFSPEGAHLMSWGALGSGPGEFFLPHGLAFVDEEHIVVCDRENYRLQVFTLAGELCAVWHSFHPCAIASAGGVLFVGELGPPSTKHQPLPNLGNRVSVLNRDGEMIAAIGSGVPGFGADQFVAPHGIAVDSRGDLYVAEVAWTWLTAHHGLAVDLAECTSLRKWRRVPAS